MPRRDVSVSTYCRACDYILSGLTSHRCPECGQPFNLDDPQTYFDAPRAILRKRIRWKRTKRCFRALLILAPIEAGAALLAYETIGEVESVLLVFVVVLGNLIALALALFRLPRVSLGLMVLLAVVIVPMQAWLGVRWLMLRYEASRIVAYSEDHKARFGEYPFDLRDYPFTFGSNREYIQIYERSTNDGGFILYWYIGTPTASHW